MEIDELKQIWKDTSSDNQSNINIMELIQQKNYGPLAALKNTYRKQIIMMAIIPFVLIVTNAQNMDKVFTSILFWSYVAFCMCTILFALYNYQIVKSMQVMDNVVKSNIERQITLLEKRAGLEIKYLRAALVFFIILIELVPYFQYYSMLNKWHSLPLLIRAASYLALLLFQFFVNRQLKDRKIGRHLAYLKKLIGQME